jgi:hypothetical protein
MEELDVVVNVVTKGTEKLGGIGKSLGGLGKFAAVGLGAATAGVAVLGGAVANMAIEAETTQAKLENTFKSMNAASFTTVKQLDAQATALAKATTFDDDAIKEFQTTMLTFGNVTGKVFEESVEVGADMAAFFGTDMQGAAVQLGKALNDPIKGITALSRVGVSFTDQQKEQIKTMTEAGDVAGAQGIILAELEKQVGGTATALAETTGGQIGQAMEDLGEAGESLGTLLLPLFAGLAQGVAGFANFIVENMPKIQAAIAPVISFITGLFNNAGGAIGGLSTVFGMVVQFWKENGPVLASVAGQVFGAIANVAKVVIPILLEIAKVVFPILATAGGILFKALDIAFKGIGGAFEVLGNVFDTVSGFIKDTIEGVVGFVKGAWNAFASVWNGIQISVPSVDIPFVGVVGGFSIGLPDLPHLAKGGIVTRPTLALIGESGPEAVIPLRGSETPGTVNNFEFHIRSPIPDEKAVISLVSRSQRLQAMLPS